MNVKSLLEYYKNPHFQSLLGNGSVALLGLVTLSILYRNMSFENIGTYIFFIAMLSLVDTIRNGFLYISFVKFYSGTEKEKGYEVVGSTWMLAVITTIGCLVANIPTYFLADLVDNAGLKLFFKYFSLITLVTLPSFMAGIVLQGERRFDLLLQLRLFAQLSFTGSVIGLTVLGHISLDSVILTYGITNLLTSIFSILRGWTMFEKISQSTKAMAMELFHFGKYSFGTSISANLFQITNTFFINFFLGPAALAIYNLGARLLQIIEIPLLSIASSGMPLMSAYYNQGMKEDMMFSMRKLTGMLTIAIMFATIFSLIFAEPIIALIGGSKYILSEAPNLFRIFMLYAILYPMDRFFAITLDVIHLPKVNFYKILVMLAINCSFNYFSLLAYNSIYAITLMGVFPTLAAIIISYRPINNYYPFSIGSIFSIGYSESLSFVKKLLQNFK